MEIWLSTLDRKVFFKFPYISNEGVEFSSPLNTEEFENSDGKILTLIGEKGLRQIKISSFFPHKKYHWLPFSALLAPLCLKFIKAHRKSILRVTVLHLQETFTMTAYISDFNYRKKRNNDVDYDITLTEYISK